MSTTWSYCDVAIGIGPLILRPIADESRPGFLILFGARNLCKPLLLSISEVTNWSRIRRI